MSARLLLLVFLLLPLQGQAADDSTWVYTCDQPTQQSETNTPATNNWYGQCTGGAQNGYWVEIKHGYWWETQIDGSDFADLLLVILFCFCAAWAVRMVMDVIRGRR